MYRISPFTPLFFQPSRDAHGADSKCVQAFAKSDHILIEVIATNEANAPTALKVKDNDSGVEYSYSWQSWTMNSSTKIYFVELWNMDEGKFTVVIEGVESEPFCITDDSNVLADTVLIQYSNRDNKQRNDCVFWIDSVQKFFDFRIPGGFKDDNWTFLSENEQFTTSDNDKMDISGSESTIKSLTLGNNIGCPVWFAEKLNKILCCNYVYLDGVRYARNESDVPEMNAEVEGLKSYVFKQTLQRIVNIDPSMEEANRLAMRRVDSDYGRKATIGGNSTRLIIID